MVPNNKKDMWFFVGKNTKFFPYAISQDMLDIGDIAHALSHQVRFLGHVNRFYSVAEHSVLVLKIMEKLLAPLRTPADHKIFLKHALMHDSAEAYINDMPSPLKQMFPGYQELEHSILKSICKRYSIIWPIPTPIKKLVKYCDQIALSTEVTKLKKHTDLAAWALPEPLNNSIIEYWSPLQAEIQFLKSFDKLFLSK